MGHPVGQLVGEAIGCVCTDEVLAFGDENAGD